MQTTFELSSTAKLHFLDADVWTYKEAEQYGFLLLKIASADGPISDREMYWLLKRFAEEMGIPGAVTEKWRAFSYETANLHELVQQIPSARATNFVYDAIRICAADGLYAFKERKAVEAASILLKVPAHVLQGLEFLVEQETLCEKQLTALLKQGN